MRDFFSMDLSVFNLKKCTYRNEVPYVRYRLIVEEFCCRVEVDYMYSPLAVLVIMMR